MTPAQRAALEGVVRRVLTTDEVEQIDPLLDPDNRNDVQIAATLSVGRTRLADIAIGVGDVLNTLRRVGSGGGVFLDTLQALGQQDRDLFYVYKLLESGRLHINLPSVREGMAQLAQAVPAVAPQIEALMGLGIEPDPFEVLAVSDALNRAEGRMQL